MYSRVLTGRGGQLEASWRCRARARTRVARILWARWEDKMSRESGGTEVEALIARVRREL